MKPVIHAVNKVRIFLLLTVLCPSIFTTGFGQSKKISIRFALHYGNEPLVLDKKYAYRHDSADIETLKFYISGIQLYHNDQPVTSFSKKHWLVDAEDSSSLLLEQNFDQSFSFNRIRCNIGIDSITNEAGAIGSDLDPTNGMYWTWQSGYINFKLEGHTRLCPARKNQFTYHIGGYQYPFNTLQNLDLAVTGSNNIILVFDVHTLLNQLNTAELYEVMSPNEKAMNIAKKICAAYSTLP